MRTIWRWSSAAGYGAALALFLVGGTSASAQSGSPPAFHEDADFQKGTVEVGAIIGNTLPVSWLRAHADRNITMGSLEAGRVMTNRLGRGPLAGQFEFLLEISPLMIVHQSSRAFGLTASPLHMRWNFSSIRGLRPFAEASGGIVVTSQAVPLGTTTFNFIDQAGFGLRFEAGAKRAWLAGYRFQHISNAGRVKPNPGANFNFFYVGVSFLR